MGIDHERPRMKWLWTPFLIPPLQTPQTMPWYYYPLTLGEAEAAAYIGLETENRMHHMPLGIPTVFLAGSFLF